MLEGFFLKKGDFMDILKKHFYVILYVIPFMICFYIFRINGFCTNFVLDSVDATMLENGAGGDLAGYAFNSSGDILVYGVDQILTDINTKLYQNYGWDLETVSWEVEDALTQSVKDNINQKMALGATVGEFAKLYATTAYQNTWGKLFVLAEENAHTGNLEVVSDNMLVKVHDGLLTPYLNARAQLKQSNDIIDFSNLNVCFSDNFRFYSNYDFAVYSFDLSRKFLLYNSESVNSSSAYQQIGVIYPDSFGDFTSFFSDGFGIGTSGSQYAFDNISCDNPKYIDINGITYRYGTIRLHYNRGWSNLQTMYKLNLHLNDVVSILQNYDLYGNFVDSYSYNFDNNTQLENILGKLTDRFCTTDDLAKLEELILQLPVVTDNTGSLVIDGAYQDILDRIDALVEDMKDFSEAIEGELDYTVTPDPEPIEYNDQGIAIPPNFNNNMITNVSNIFGLPLQFIGIFSPIFRIFGSNIPLLNLWMFFPIILIIGIIIWVLK